MHPVPHSAEMPACTSNTYIGNVRLPKLYVHCATRHTVHDAPGTSVPCHAWGAGLLGERPISQTLDKG